MGWKKKDPVNGVTVEMDDDVSEEAAEALFAADADGSDRRIDHPEEMAR